MASPPYTECYIFVDDSNLWIEGQKVGTNAKQDTSFRVDHGKFLSLVAKDYHKSKAFLYTSMSPPNDTVWKTTREENYDIKMFKRSGSGKEKEVDVAMATGMIQELHTLQSKENTVFIVVTGDRDLRPPIEAVLEQNVPVELWSWEHSMAREYKKMARNQKLFTTNILDSHRDEFRCTAKMSACKKKDINPDHAIVYRDVPKGERFIKELSAHISRLSKFLYYVSIPKEGTCDVILEFPNSTSDTILKKLRKLKEEFDFTPCSYPEYTSRHISKKSQPIELTNRFEILDVQEEKDEPPLELEAITRSMSMDLDKIDESLESDSEDNSDDWSDMLKPEMLKKLKKRKQEQCGWGDHCAKGLKCPYSHTEEEKEVFSRFPSVPLQYLKTKLCKKKEHHLTAEQRKMCAFAHVSEDSWCLSCKKYGHLTSDCKLPKVN